MIDFILEMRRKVLDGGALTREEALRLTRASGPEIPYLAAAANEVRRHFVGDEVETCALSNIKSGACSEDCKFCSQSGHYRTESPVYPQIGVDEILRQAKEAEAMGATEFCLVSSGWGATSQKEFEVVVEAVRRITSETTLFADCSLGFLTPEQMARLKEAGLYRNNHNLEAAKGYFGKVCTTHTFEDRFRHVDLVRHAGIHPCSGGILGMGESVEDRIDLALSLRELGADCVPINILNARPGTPLEGAESLAPLEIIKYIAIYRLLLPKATLKIAGGREVNLRDLQAMALLAGGNGLIIGNYLTTMGRRPEHDRQMLEDLGFRAAKPARPAPVSGAAPAARCGTAGCC